MQKVALVSALLCVILLTLQGVAAREASVAINITAVVNYNPLNVTNESAPDVTNAVFVGNNPTAIGNGYVILPLTANQEIISDTPGSDDVPGLYVRRGEDQNGPFIEVSSYGFNAAGTGEGIAFTLTLANAHIITIVNDSSGPYEGIGDGSCGATTQGAWDDEFTFQPNGTVAELCSFVSPHYDRARLYYHLDDIFGPQLTNIHVTPSLPHNVDESESERFTVSFTSDEYPLTTFFRLLNEHGIEVHASGNRTIVNASELPLTYDLSSSIHPGTYSLQLVAYDSLNNEARTTLGTIRIHEDDSSSSDRRARTLVSEEERASYVASLEERRTPPRIQEEEPIMLRDTPKRSSTYTSLISLIIALASTCVLLIILIIITAALKK